MRLTHLHIPTRFLTRSARKTDTYARSVQGAQAIAKGVGRPLRQPGARVGRQCEPSMFTGSAPPQSDIELVRPGARPLQLPQRIAGRVDRDDPADATQKDCTRGPGSPQMVQGSWSGPPTRTLEGQRGGARGRAPQATRHRDHGPGDARTPPPG